MRDYEYLFATTLHEKLKEKIVGGIFVNVTPDDVLHITIKNGDIVYFTDFEDFSNSILNGWTTEYAAYEVERRFKGFIHKRYFDVKPKIVEIMEESL